MERGVLVKFDKKIFDRAYFFGVYLRIPGEKQLWLINDEIYFTDYGTLIYWDGRAWIRGSGKEELYIVLPENTLDIFPSADKVGKVNVYLTPNNIYSVNYYELEGTIKYGYGM